MSPPPRRAWKGTVNRSRTALAAEQNRAAGGPEQRWVKLSDGTFAQASVELRFSAKQAHIRAYLRWTENERSAAKCLGIVDHETRAENLRQGWAIAQTESLVAERPIPSDSYASSRAVRAVMQGNRGKNTRPEVRLRSILHGMGLRYRVAARPLAHLRRTADLVFVRPKIAVFLDGCFWHGCPEHYRPATRNSQFWAQKIHGNKARDDETSQLLLEAGWTVIRIWEHEDMHGAAERISSVVRARR